MRSYARYWREAFRLPSMDRDAVLARTDSHGTATMFEALEQGRGVVAALPHSGNWDIAGLWFVQTQARLGRGPITTVVERLRPESLFRRFVAYREGLGFEVLAAGDGPVVYRTLCNGCAKVAWSASSRTATERDRARGVVFGEPAKLPSGPAWLAARTGAPSSRRSRRSPRTAGRSWRWPTPSRCPSPEAATTSRRPRRRWRTRSPR